MIEGAAEVGGTGGGVVAVGLPGWARSAMSVPMSTTTSRAMRAMSGQVHGLRFLVTTGAVEVVGRTVVEGRTRVAVVGWP